MQCRIQFLDGRANVIRELTADAYNAVGDAVRKRAQRWPPHAVTMRVLDTDGREVHSEVKGRERAP
jgi:hypothetical protein